MSELKPHIARLLKYSSALVIILALFVFFEAGKTLREFSYVGRDVPAMQTISVAGEGEVVAIPDVAQFTFSIVEEADTVALAQEAVATKEGQVLDQLKEQGVDEADIKTTGYNVNPRYEFRRSICTETFCPPSGERELVGYEVRQSVRVKVRDTGIAGDILANIGSTGVQSISGLSFQIDDDDALRAEARSKAIADARAKAEKLADDLGVDLARVVNFFEQDDSYMPYRAYGMGGDMVMESSVPQLPTGENQIISNVNITYEIR